MEQVVRHYGTKGMKWGVRKRVSGAVRKKVGDVKASRAAEKKRVAAERTRIAKSDAYAKKIVSEASDKDAVAAGIIAGVVEAAFGGSYISSVTAGIGVAAVTKALSTGLGNLQVAAIRKQEKKKSGG